MLIPVQSNRILDATTIKVMVKKTHDSRVSCVIEFPVDSRAMYSVVSSAVLTQLGYKPYREKVFFLADGSKVTRRIGDTYFEFKGIGGPAPVVFGEKRDRNLLGVTTLEALELVLDLFRGDLRPMTTNLLGAAPAYSTRGRSRG